MNTRKRVTYIIILLALLVLALCIWWLLPSKRIFKQVTFEQLPGWGTANLNQSLKSFQVSCRVFVKQNPELKVGSPAIDLQVKDWLPACNEALKINKVTQQASKSFFQRWFVPIEFYDKQALTGLFTGYYMPTLQGSRKQTSQFSVPIYEMPKNLVSAHLNQFSPDLNNMQLIGRVGVGIARADDGAGGISGIPAEAVITNAWGARS